MNIGNHVTAFSYADCAHGEVTIYFVTWVSMSNLVIPKEILYRVETLGVVSKF